MLIDEFGSKVDSEVLGEKIIFYGASTRNKKAIDELNLQEKVLFFVDSDKEKQGQQLDNYAIESVDNLSCRNDCVVVSVLIEHMQEVLDCMRKYNVHCFFYILEKFNIEKTVQSNWKVMDMSSTYRYIHIFPDEKFIKPFYDMIEEQMDISEHLFILDYRFTGDKYGYSVYEDMQRRNIRYHNILFLDDVHGIPYTAPSNINCNLIYEDERLKNILHSAKKIFLHSMFFRQIMQEKLSEWADEFGSKMVWLAWGGDSYFDKEDYKVKNILKKLRCAYVAEEMRDRVQKNYEIKTIVVNSGGYCYIPYNKLSSIYHKEEGCKYILLGHSAAEYENHILGLDLLYQWQDKNIKIYSPLSYGLQDYRDKVITKGKEMFGDKFIPIVDFIELYEYYTFLNSIDVAVLPMTRMAGGTTLSYLTSKNKKIYLKKEILESYISSGIVAEDIELIKNQSFQQFLQVNKHITYNINDISVKEWIKILNDNWEESYDTI